MPTKVPGNRVQLTLAIRRAIAAAMASGAAATALAQDNTRSAGLDGVAKGVQSGTELVVNSSAGDFDGECGVAVDGCSLADALVVANQQSPQPVSITFDPAVMTGATIMLTSTLPTVTGNITVTGLAGLTIQRDPALGCSFNNELDAGEFRLLTVSRGSLDLADVTLSGGCADSIDGGALAAGVPVTLRRVTLQGNSASSGGGVATSDAPLTLVDSTVTGNYAEDNGGGVYGNGGDVSLIQSTISGNTAENGGGGLFLFGSSAGDHRVIDSTIAYNFGLEGAALALNGADLVAERSLLAGSESQLLCQISGGQVNATDVLASDATCQSNTMDLEQLRLEPLQQLGVATPLHPLGEGSAAIDAAGTGCSGLDQRGQPRGFDGDGDGEGQCDVGAFEVQERPQQSQNLVVNSAEGTFDGICGDNEGGCTLPDAVAAANRAPGLSEIQFDLQANTITLENSPFDTLANGLSALPPVIQPLAIEGAEGVTIGLSSSGLCRRFLYANGFDLRLSNLSLSGGCATGQAGGALWVKDATLVANTVMLTGNTADLGGGIYASGVTVSTVNSSLSANTAVRGGGLLLLGSTLVANTFSLLGNTASEQGGGLAATDSEVTLTGSTITGNTAADGAGFYGDVTETCCRASAQVTIDQSIITGNTSSNRGGGVMLAGIPSLTVKSSVTGNRSAKGDGTERPVTIQLTNSAINENSAQTGGGLWIQEATVLANTFDLTGNTVSNLGGGIYGSAMTLDLSNSTISGNTASFGGGIYGRAQTCCPANANVRLSQSTISGNSALEAGGGAMIYGNTFDISNSSIVSNTAQRGGGILSAGDSRLAVTDSAIASNSAGEAGGLMISDKSGLAASNNTFSGNTASSGAAALLVSDAVEGTEVDISGNVFSLGGGVQQKGGSPVGLCDLANTAAAATNFATDGSCGEATVVTEEALNLASDGNGVFAIPGPGSVLVDAVSDCTGVDQRGLPRGVDADGVPGNDCDIGAVEVQNTPVMATADQGATSQNQTTGGDVTGNDVDPADEDSGTLNVTAVAGSEAAVGVAQPASGGGTVTIFGNGQWTFDPGADFVALDQGGSGSATVSHTVSDGYAEDMTELVIEVMGVNDPPVANATSASTDQNTSVEAPFSAMDPDLNEPLTFSVLSAPALGAVTEVNNDLATFTFDPLTAFRDLDDGESQEASFSFGVADEARSDTNVVTVTVNGVNDPPVAENDRYFVVQGETLNVSVTEGLLANDVDVDVEPLSVTTVGSFSAGGAGGDLTLAADGSLQFDAPPQTGVSTLTYMVSDGDLSGSAEVLIDVVTANSADLRIEKSDGETV
ncbi:MAG: Ig-like domain-containing protein, partial [Pseudomonadota bacterium]